MYYSRVFITADWFHIRETAPEVYGQKPNLSDWPEDELARVRVVLHKLTSLRVQNPADAEDLVQETLLTMTAKCPEIELEKGLLIWGMGILRNKVGNYYRKARRCLPLADRGPRGADAASGTAAQSPETILRHSELRILIDLILAEFSSHEREPIELLLAGLPTSEIAARLRPEKYQNVVNRIHRGRRRLASQLRRYGYASRPSRARRPERN